MEEKNKRQQIIIRICCVIASAILWLYIFNVENPMRERKISVPVQVINKDVLAQSKLVPVGEEQISATLTLRGNASDIYSVKSTDFKLESDLGAYVVRKGENKIPVTVKKAPQSVRIVNSENLWVTIMLDDLSQKIVNAKVIVDGKAKEGFFAMQPIYKTTEVQINGPADAVNSVSSVVARCDVKNSTKDVKSEVALQPVNSSGDIVKDISIKPDSIQVTVPVKKIKSVPVNLKIQGNLNSEGNIKSIIPVPETIDIAGDEKVISNINGLDTENIDISQLYNKDNVEVKIVIPQNVTLVNSNGTIKLKINLDKNTQKEFNLNIQTRNLGNSYTVSLDVDKAVINVTGAENIINSLRPENIECYVDLASLSEGEHVVNVIVNTPSGVSKISQSPSTVKAVITKKLLEGKNVDQNK